MWGRPWVWNTTFHSDAPWSVCAPAGCDPHLNLLQLLQLLLNCWWHLSIFNLSTAERRVNKSAFVSQTNPLLLFLFPSRDQLSSSDLYLITRSVISAAERPGRRYFCCRTKILIILTKYSENKISYAVIEFRHKHHLVRVRKTRWFGL